MNIRVEDFWIDDNRWSGGNATLECPDLGCKWYVDAHGETLGELLAAARWHIAHGHGGNGRDGAMAEMVSREPIGRREAVECTCDLHEVTTPEQAIRGEFEYMRGLANGCLIHGTDEQRARMAALAAADEDNRARREAAMKAAREAP